MAPRRGHSNSGLVRDLGLLDRLFRGKKRVNGGAGEKKMPEIEEHKQDRSELDELLERMNEMKAYQKQYMEFREQVSKTADEVMADKKLSPEERERRLKEVEEKVGEIKKLENEFNREMAKLRKKVEEIRRREHR